MRNWKLPPDDPSKLWINPSLELQIILACNWACVSCDQGSQFSSFDFVRKGTMTFDQINHFISEMIDANAYIGRIRILGGEPTVHRHFNAITHLLHDELVVKGHVGQLEVVTNGSHVDRANTVKHIARIRYSGRAEKERTHTANLVHTPASLGYQGKICNAPWHCGISLNYWGYFPCSSGAGVARFEDWMQWQRLELPKPKRQGKGVWDTWPELQELCNHCYHGLKAEDKIKSGMTDSEKNKPGPHIAAKIDSWHSGKKVEWKRYGDSS